MRLDARGLFFLPGPRGAHIARTNIAGCTTECGVVLVRGQDYTTGEPPDQVCRECRAAIATLNDRQGLRA